MISFDKPQRSIMRAEESKRGKMKTFRKKVIFKDGTEHIGLYEKETDKFIKWIQNPNSNKTQLKKFNAKNGFVEIKSDLFIEEKIRRAYKTRNRKIKKLGYLSYKDYLDSDEWKSLRLKVLNKYNNKCILCKNKANQVHHIGYNLSVLKCENIKRLVPLCNKCHYFIEFDENGNKLHIKVVQDKLARMLPESVRLDIFS